MKKLLLLLLCVPLIGWSQIWEENGKYTYSNKDITLKVSVFEYGEEISIVIINNYSKQEIMECESYWHSINMRGVDEDYDGPDGFYEPCDYDFELSESYLILSMYLWSYDENKDVKHILHLQWRNSREEDNY